MISQLNSSPILPSIVKLALRKEEKRSDIDLSLPLRLKKEFLDDDNNSTPSRLLLFLIEPGEEERRRLLRCHACSTLEN